MKKVLLINNGYPSARHPNYVTYIESIKDCLEGAGFKTDLLVLNSSFNSFTGKYVQYCRYYLRLLFFRHYGKYDFVYLNNYPYSFLPMIPHFRKMKHIIIHWHGDDIFPSTGFSRVLNFLSYQFIRKDVIHMAPSQYFAGKVSQTIGIPEQEIFVSPSGGVDTDVFYRTDAGKRKKGLIRLGFASGLIQAKGMDLVMEILKHVDTIEREVQARIEFHFIDYGAEKKYYVEALSNIKCTVKHSPYPIRSMSSFYNKIDILLFPSLRNAESLGLVALEAMACESPVVATDSFAFRDTVVAGKTGERFRINDTEAFRAAIVKCILNIEGYNAREFAVNHFSKKSVSEGYVLRLTGND